jgi:hypothetical protein
MEIDPQKQQKLVKLANVRVPRAVKAIYAVAQLVKYQPTGEQKNKILEALTDAVDSAVAQFNPEPKQGFKL